MPGNKKSSNRKKGSAVQSCPLTKGIILVQVLNSDNGKRLAEVVTELKGKTPGKAKTDSSGQSIFYDRVPGTYDLKVSLSGSKYEHYLLEPYSQKLSAVSDDITLANVKATATGNLKVSVLVEDGEGKRSLLDDEEITKVYTQSPQALSQSGTNAHTFESIKCGKYDVFAMVSSKIYDPAEAKLLKVVVPDGGTAEAEIIVTKKLWLKITVYDKEEKKGLYGINVKVNIPKVGVKNLPTNNSGYAEVGVDASSRACEILELSSTGNDYYEVIDVEHN